MTESNNITGLMIKDHCKIEKLLEDLETCIDKDKPIMNKSFYKFEWGLEKHIFTEEKAIFTLYNPEDVTEGYKMLPALTQQHNVILNKLNNMRTDVRNNKKIRELYEFKEFLIKHKTFEEREVYPKLDESLDEKQKKLIVDRISQLI
jgi:hemerythrin superfamily protein